MVQSYSGIHHLHENDDSCILATSEKCPWHIKSDKGRLQISILSMRSLINKTTCALVCTCGHTCVCKEKYLKFYVKILIDNSLNNGIIYNFCFFLVLFILLEMFSNECVLPLQLRGKTIQLLSLRKTKNIRPLSCLPIPVLHDTC